MSKEGVIAQQFLLGVVQTAEGLPIYHQVVEGHTAEMTTLLPTLNTVLTRFPTVRRVILVADRGLLSLDNLAALQAVRLASGQALEFILAVPGRRYAEFAEVLATFAPAPAYKGRFFHVSPSDSGNEPSFAGIESAGQGSGQPWPMGSGW